MRAIRHGHQALATTCTLRRGVVKSSHVPRRDQLVAKAWRHTKRRTAHIITTRVRGRARVRVGFRVATQRGRHVGVGMGGTEKSTRTRMGR